MSTSLLRRPAPAPYFHPFFNFSDLPSPGGRNQNLLPTPFKKKGGSELCLTNVNNRLIDLDRGNKVLLGFLEEKMKTLMYIHFSLLWKFLDQIQNCPIQFKNLKDWTLTFQKIGYNFKLCLKSTVMIEEILGKIEGNYSSKVRDIRQYNGSKPAKFLLRLFQNLTYFSAFSIIILVEYFVLLMLHKCYWILKNCSFNLTSLALQFVCSC